MRKKAAFRLPFADGDSHYINGSEPRWTPGLDAWASFLGRQRAQPAIAPYVARTSRRRPLWIIGVAQALLPSGSWMIAAVTIIVGGLMIILGLTQSSLMVGDFHWVVRIIHLLLGLLTIGMGHMAAARARKRSPR